MAAGPANSLGRPAPVTPPLFALFDRLVGWVRQVWRHDLIQLVGLTLYYLAIIAGLVVLYGGAEYVPPPFVYQGF